MILERFLKRTKGSITVMVTLLMIPTIFFTGFLVDLARIKLYGNQAVMAADNYGEAVLTEYDALLKDLYGLFAVTQDDQGKAAIETLQAYMKTSYDPSSNTITKSHVAGLVNPLTADYAGFMPYRNAELSFSAEYPETSALDNTEILSTQIGDFMRFRVVQLFLGTDDENNPVFGALEEAQKTSGNGMVIDKKTEVDDAAGVVLEKMRDYYRTLSRLEHYPKYIGDINEAYKTAKEEFADIVGSGHYRTYKDYVDNEDEIRKACRKDEEDRTEEDEKYIDMGDAYDSDSEARRNKLAKKFDDAIDRYWLSRIDDIVDFDSFGELSEELTSQAAEVKNAIETLKIKREELERIMEEGQVSDDLRTGIEEELREIDKLMEGDYAGDNYVRLAGCIADNKAVNTGYQDRMSDTVKELEKIYKDYLTPDRSSAASYPAPLSPGDYNNFRNHSQYETLYQSLKATFDGGNSGEEAAKSKKKEAEEKKKAAEAEMEEEETTTARDIPSIEALQGIGGNGGSGGFSVGDLAKTAGTYFACNSLGEAGNKLLLKFYTVAYDFGMFSSRTTNVQDNSVTGQEASKKAVSLTGVEMSRSVNYLYQAELEYLFGGNKSSQENLNAAKNRILAFRTVVNFTSTYTIREINDAVKAVSRACAAINPVLGIAAAAALRAGITALETAMDWKELKQGNSVVLIKKEMGDLTAADAIASLLGDDIQASGQKSDKRLELDYNQYLMVMVTFLTTSDQVAHRTADLITLNVNTVKNKVGESGELTDISFRMDKAYTAVNATCAVHLDFAVMPEGFAQQMLDGGTYGAVTDFEKNSYQFTVTRGY